jgi:anaerobic selenocysteine-containing dehydrogenase
MEEAGLLEMNVADAQARKIADGDLVRVFNRRGDIQLRPRVDAAVPTGVVSAKLLWAKLSSGSRKRECAPLGKTYRPGQLRHVLFRLG